MSLPALSPGRLLVRLLALPCALALSVGISFGDPSAPAPLTSAAQVRALSEAEARGALPVKLTGIVIGAADPQGIAFVIHDGTEGIYVQGPAESVAQLQRGDRLEIEGVTDPGGFAPYVVANHLTCIGRGTLPEPVRVTVDELNAGRLDASWVEFTGIVRSVEPKAPTDLAPPPPGTRYAPPTGMAAVPTSPKVKMKVAAGSARVVVEVNGDVDPDALVDAEVRIRGLCFNLHNRSRQFVRPFVQVPAGVEVESLRPPPAPAVGGRPRPISTLLQFEQLSGHHGHRVHVRGRVIHHRSGSGLWIRDHEHSLRVETGGNDARALQPGDEVDVFGFPARGEYSAVLEDASVRKLGSREPPAPHVLVDLDEALANDADLVQLDARLTDVRRFPDVVVLSLDWRDRPVRAQMHLPESAAEPRDWLPGSFVRVTAVCSVVADDAGPLGGLWEPRGFQLLLRQPDDLLVLQRPPWWNAERVVWVLAGFLACAVGVVAMVMLASRRRLKEQEHRRAMAEAEFTAILSERNRVAREIHDTLSQSLGAISVQLELARVHANEISPPARTHLGAALKLTRGALAEARESIWNMRSQVLEKGDLGEALQGILKQITDGTDVRAQMVVEGARRRLPPVVENNLLRIGQEAITNASRHASPTRIDVTLTFERRRVHLIVQDDGAGFTPEEQPTAGRRSFGLVGMKERAELLGGSVEIQSSRGQGTRIAVTVAV